MRAIAASRNATARAAIDQVSRAPATSRGTVARVAWLGGVKSHDSNSRRRGECATPPIAADAAVPEAGTRPGSPASMDWVSRALASSCATAPFPAPRGKVSKRRARLISSWESAKRLRGTFARRAVVQARLFWRASWMPQRAPFIPIRRGRAITRTSHRRAHACDISSPGFAEEVSCANPGPTCR